MSLSVKYVDVPAGAQENMQVTSADGQFASTDVFSQGASDMPWATLEPGSWALDGTRKLLTDAPTAIGWWSSARSGADGRFADPPILRLYLDPLGEGITYTAPGLTFWFWPSLEHWCNALQITWLYYEFNSDHTETTETVLAEATAYPTGADWTLTKEVEGFNCIEIKLLSTNIPGQFAKLQQIQIGHVTVFLQDEITRVSLLTEVDPSCCELSADALTVAIYDKKGRSLKPRKNQQVQLYRNEELVAAHYIQGFSRESKSAYTFLCQSAIGRLEDDFLGGIYEEYPVTTLLGEVLEGFAADWSAFAGQTVTGYLPVCTRREALQQIAFAIGAVVTTQGDGTIRLEPLQEKVSAVFDGSNIFTGAKLSQEPRVSAVEVVAHQYTKSEETETLLDGVLVEGQEVLFIFNEPHYAYEKAAGTPGSHIESGPNWVKITASLPERVTLTAKKYLHTTKVLRWENNKASAAEAGNVVKVEAATLINDTNAEGTLARVCAYHTLKHVLTQDAVIDTQKAGQKAESVNPWGTLTAGYITRMESAFTGTGHTANVTIRGEEKEPNEAEVLKV